MTRAAPTIALAITLFLTPAGAWGGVKLGEFVTNHPETRIRKLIQKTGITGRGGYIGSWVEYWRYAGARTVTVSSPRSALVIEYFSRFTHFSPSDYGFLMELHRKGRLADFPIYHDEHDALILSRIRYGDLEIRLEPGGKAGTVSFRLTAGDDVSVMADLPYKTAMKTLSDALESDPESLMGLHGKKAGRQTRQALLQSLDELSLATLRLSAHLHGLAAQGLVSAARLSYLEALQARIALLRGSWFRLRFRKNAVATQIAELRGEVAAAPQHLLKGLAPLPLEDKTGARPGSVQDFIDADGDFISNLLINRLGFALLHGELMTLAERGGSANLVFSPQVALVAPRSKVTGLGVAKVAATLTLTLPGAGIVTQPVEAEYTLTGSDTPGIMAGFTAWKQPFLDAFERTLKHPDVAALLPATRRPDATLADTAIAATEEALADEVQRLQDLSDAMEVETAAPPAQARAVATTKHCALKLRSRD